MSLGSGTGSGTYAGVVSAGQSDALLVDPGVTQAQPSSQTVLMSVRVSVCHSGIRPLCLPGAGGESLRLQLSMDQGKSGDFRLSLFDNSVTGWSNNIAEYDLRSIKYEVKSPKCHELSLVLSPNDSISFNFRCEQEAQEWATVLMSSLRETHRVPKDNNAQQPQNVFLPSNISALQRTEESCIELSRAIEAGDIQAASVFAATLARQQASLRIQRSTTTDEDKEINLTVVVEDSWSSCCVTIKVQPHMTTAALKQQMFLEYGFHPLVQRWVIGQCMCANQRSLASYGVRQDGNTAFLYLLSAQHAGLTQYHLQKDKESLLFGPSSPSSSQTPDLPYTSANRSSTHNQRPYSTFPSGLGTGASPGGSIAQIKDLIHFEMPQLNEALNPNTSSAQGWPCPSCTFINKPTRPGCEICSTNRPENYTVPFNYTPDALELRRLQQEKEAVRQYQQDLMARSEAMRNSLSCNLDQNS